MAEIEFLKKYAKQRYLAQSLSQQDKKQSPDD